MPLLKALRNYEYEAQYNDGSLYKGGLNSSFVPHGTGTISTIDGITMRGDWRNGHLSRGSILSSENLYVGSCVADKPSGNGRMIYADGSQYNGEWKCGMRSGHGTLTCENGEFYSGDWLMNVPWGVEGECRLIVSPPTRLLSQRNGKRKQTHAYAFSDKQAPVESLYYGFYRGSWEAGLRSGEGTMTIPISPGALGDNNEAMFIYEGSWKQDLPHGFGLVKTADQLVRGYWKEGVMQTQSNPAGYHVNIISPHEID